MKESRAAIDIDLRLAGLSVLKTTSSTLTGRKLLYCSQRRMSVSNLVNGEAPRIHNAFRYLLEMLVVGESLECMAIQRRLFAITHRREILSPTTGRLIGMRRGLFGGYTPVDIRWQDIKNVQISSGIFGSDLVVTAFTQPDLAINGRTQTHVFGGLRKAQAQAIYRICQAQEQAWREKRRVRELEELRAKSGGVTLGQGSLGDMGSTDVLTRLAKAKELLTAGLISDSEYEVIKTRVVSAI